MILDEKTMLQLQLQPPPPYPASGSCAPPPFPHKRAAPTLSTMPTHILLQIVHMTFPQTPDRELQRKTLYWFSVGLRLVNRALYVACMHVLRSTYLPAYDSLIRPPYSSDPFPLPTSPQSPFASTSTPSQLQLNTLQRETATLDMFIAVKVREDVWADDSELYLERDEAFKDLFDHAQPRSRLEDLVRVYGVQEGVVNVAADHGHGSLAPPSGSSGNTTPSPTSGVFRIPHPPPSPTSPLSPVRGKSKQPARQHQQHPHQPPPIPFSALHVSFSTRKVGLLLGRSRHTIVETDRSRDELLEAAARRLVRQLGVWLRQAHAEGRVYC
ncbi:hypothetical protein HMN09_01205200 [Mycena chlorophos]|uniref:Uncharacterized protein n=1 Tax=Mycena chlorophos TaxID=658473 RepID=A0A8H6VVB3_MYCCL|nr:hypothetical protein HMN09_01205200 [Mycena chlorophos]